MGGGGGEGAGGCGHALAAFKYSLNTWVVARPGWCGVGGEGAGGCGHALAAFKYSLNTKKMRARSACVVARKRRPGGVWAVGVVRTRGGVGTHWQPLNTL